MPQIQTAPKLHETRLPLSSSQWQHDAWHLDHSYNCATAGNDAKQPQYAYNECEHVCTICTHYEYCDRLTCDVAGCGYFYQGL